MNDRPKLTIKKPLSLEKQSQLSQGLQYLAPNMPKKLSAKEQEHLMKQAQKKKREGIKTALGWLYEKFPACFNIKEIKPLKLHIEKDIYPYLDQEGAPSRIKVRLALKYYTQNINYIKALITDTHRYDLSGHQVEEITQEQKAYAQDKLDKILQIIKTKNRYKNKSSSQEKADNS
ncbi:MAG: hypothetical protein BGO77_03075 [Caedibacter sp. 37-49]|nr:MAG: hypothetical protein BGO77_03075 [Caedibacter sp. 37-49]